MTEEYCITERQVSENHIKAPLRLWLTGIFVALGTAFPTFLDLYFPSNGRPAVQQFFERSFGIGNGTNRTDAEETKINTIWSIYTSPAAMLIGKLMTPIFDNTTGRRKTLIICCSMVNIGLMMEFLAQPTDLWILSFLGRFYTQFLCGVITDMSPVFLNEISPPEIRGTMGMFFPMALVLGAAVGSGLGLKFVLGTSTLWPYTYLVALACFAAVVPFLMCLPDTPQCVQLAIGLEKAKPKMQKALMFYHGSLRHWEGVIEMRNNNQKRAKTTPCTSFIMFSTVATSKFLQPSFLITFALAASYVFSGIPFLNFYSFTIMKEAKLADPGLFSFGLQVLSFMLLLICFFLIDRVGRRPLLLVSCFGSAACWTVLVFTKFFMDSWSWKPYFILGFIILAQIFINIGVKPLIFPIVPELFPAQMRAAGVATSGVLSDFMQIPLVYALPLLINKAGSMTYLLLVIPLTLSSLFLFFKFPETKQRTPEEITAVLHKKFKIAQVSKIARLDSKISPECDEEITFVNSMV